MDKNMTKLWGGGTQLPPLRKPYTPIEDILANKHLTQSQNVETKAENVNNSFSATDVAKKSTLSVEAQEWYPPGYVVNNVNAPIQEQSNRAPQKSSVQNRLNKYRLQQQQELVENNENKSRYDEQIQYLNDTVVLLTIKPGKFDDVVVHIIDYFEPFFQDVEVISKVTSIIFQQALNEANFQYTGARLFAVLDANCPLVRACLHSLCESELDSTNNLQNLILFYAEIYSQLNYELFGKCLLKAIKKTSPNKNNVKYICQTLKLTGRKLEELDKAMITGLLSELNYLRNKLPSSLANLVESVIKLQASQWGQADLHETAPPSEPCDWNDGPVFYGPDGRQLTSEESEFLAENLNDLILDDTDPDALWNPEPEMSEEIQAAFAEFVRANNPHYE